MSALRLQMAIPFWLSCPANARQLCPCRGIDNRTVNRTRIHILSVGNQTVRLGNQRRRECEIRLRAATAVLKVVRKSIGQRRCPVVLPDVVFSDDNVRHLMLKDSYQKRRKNSALSSTLAKV